ncbi:MAG: ABC transporter ATP-binding protein, partial [Thermomicrobiales bacterium]
MASSAPLLSIDQLQVYYGMSHVLQGTSLSVPEGRILALVGRNGVGKTTLVNAVMGLAPVQSGTIHFEGVALRTLPATRRKSLGIALVPQGRRVFRSLTVDEHLGLVSTSREHVFSREWVYATFPRLAERRRSLASNLSGGEQSMLAIGRALTVNPRLLIMDEPTEGLAPLLVETVRGVVEQLRRQGLTVLLVEQNLRFALEVADQVAVMHRGSIDHVYQRQDIANVGQLADLILEGQTNVHS